MHAGGCSPLLNPATHSGNGALIDDDVILMICMSVCRQHRRLTYIRQFGRGRRCNSLLLWAKSYRLCPSGWYTRHICLLTLFW